MAALAEDFTLQDRYEREEGTVLLTGVQALVRLPVDQRRADAARSLRTGALITGYPGSPLGGLDLELARQAALLAEHGVVHVPAVNEELAATAVWGSQLVPQLPDPKVEGVVGFWYGKAPGLDRASDALRHANLSGVPATGGAMALVGDDAMAKSSTVPSASEPLLLALQIPTLTPGTVQDVHDLGLHGIALSRAAGTWAALKVATNVADAIATVDVAPDRIVPVPVALTVDGAPYVHTPTMRLVGEPLLALERSLEGRLDAARRYARANGLNRILGAGRDARLGLAAMGKSYTELRQALDALGLEEAALERLGIRLLQVRMPFPLDGETVREFARGLREVLVVEEKGPFLERLVKEELYHLPDRPAVTGKRDLDGAPLLPPHGELGVEQIAAAVGARVLALGDEPVVRERLAALRRPGVAPLPVARMPYFCSGCPHNTSVATVPEGALVGAGIGCHGMAVVMRPEEVGNITGLTQMGGEGAQWIGQSPFVGTDHLIQNLGDGTFHHSGSLAVRASVGAGTNITYKLLWNKHISMTGGQEPTASLSLADVTRWFAAEGIRRIIITTDDPDQRRGEGMAAGVEVWHRDRILEAQEVLARVPGTTVLIHDQECAAEQRRARKRGKLVDPPQRVVIDERVCEGCGDCGAKSNCLSVQPVDTEFGRKTRIDQGSCNKDYSCLAGDCPSFLVVIPPEGGAVRAPLPAALDAAVLPPPVVTASPERFAMRIAGIGGTGVVTVSQTLATAATLDGLVVCGLDQTGMAQKGGPVVSDLKLGRSVDDRTNKLASGECDLLVVADLLTGTAPAQLAVADAQRTTAVVSTARVPTGRMVVDTGTAFPEQDGLLARLGRRTCGEAVRLDAPALARALTGDELVANMLLVGAAYQAGVLPISAAAIERAIELNGAAVPRNIQAFRRGRQSVADPAALAAAVAPPAAPPRAPGRREAAIIATVRADPGSELARLVRVRVPELVAYQDARYAERYARVVERVRAAEAERVPGERSLAEAVAFSLHKLMAYKDEYEVARLHTDPAVKQDLEATFGPGTKVSWQLHPPLLRALGLDHKIGLGAWFAPALRSLARGKRVRGTRLDPFGRAEVRRVERALIDEYLELVDELIGSLGLATHATAVELAALPDMVRGYEDIKLANVARYRTRVAELRAALAEAGTTPALAVR